MWTRAEGAGSFPAVATPFAMEHVDVPPDGVKSKTPTPDELLANLDGGNGKRRPANLTNESLQQQIDRMNSQRTAGK